MWKTINQVHYHHPELLPDPILLLSYVISKINSIQICWRYGCHFKGLIKSNAVLILSLGIESIHDCHPELLPDPILCLPYVNIKINSIRI